MSTWLINYSSDVSKGRVQGSVVIIVTSWMKNPFKKPEYTQFLHRFQALPLLSLRNSDLTKNLITISEISSNNVFQPIYQG